MLQYEVPSPPLLGDEGQWFVCLCPGRPALEEVEVGVGVGGIFGKYFPRPQVQQGATEHGRDSLVLGLEVGGGFGQIELTVVTREASADHLVKAGDPRNSNLSYIKFSSLEKILP